MKYFLATLMWVLFAVCKVNSQQSLDSIIAKSGDGIFSLLRNEGISPSKYYAEFVSLNKDKIKEGSKLKVGEAYLLPYAPDSFKNMGRLIAVSNEVETAIFKNGIANLSLESEKLKDAVYYLISQQKDTDISTKKFTDAMIKDLARRLLVNSAKVYIIKDDSIETLQDYTTIINKCYLKNRDKYQRLLLVQSDGLTNSKKLDVSIYHHGSSEDSERLANNIESVLQKNSTRKLSIENKKRAFQDKDNLFFAKNILPAITVVEIASPQNKGNVKVLSVQSDKKALAKWLSNGIFEDYAELEIEE